MEEFLRVAAQYGNEIPYDSRGYEHVESDESVEQAYMNDFMLDTYQEGSARIEVDCRERVVIVDGAQKEVGQLENVPEKMALVDDGFVTSMTTIAFSDAGCRQKLVALSESAHVYYCGRPVRAINIPSYGAEHVMPDVLDKCTFAGTYAKHCKAHNKIHHVYGFVDGVSEWDGVVFSVRCWAVEEEFFFLYDTQTQRISRVSADGITWLRRDVHGHWINMMPQVHVSVINEPMVVVSKPSTSSLMMVDGVWYYVPERHKVTVRVVNGQHQTRDAYVIGETSGEDRYDVLEPRSRVVLQAGISTNYCTTRSQFIALEKAAILSDVLAYMPGIMLHPVTISFRNDYDYNTFQKSNNHSISLLTRIGRVLARPVIKTYSDAVAFVFSGMHVGDILSYDDFVWRMKEYSVGTRVWFRSYKMYKQGSREYPERDFKVVIREANRSFFVRTTLQTMYVLLSKIIKEVQESSIANGRKVSRLN